MNKKKLGFGLLVVCVAVLWPSGALGYLSDLWGHWSAGFVTTLEVRGIVNGDDRGLFAPDAPLTRAQLAKMLTVALGYEAEAEGLRQLPSRFRDVPAWHWARGYVELVAELGLAAGYPGGFFAPDEPVSRAEFALIAVRAAGLADRAPMEADQPTGYADDALIPGWARGAVRAARAEGLLYGTPDGRFHPDRPVTRAEGATLVYRLMARSGDLYHLAGTLTEFDPDRRTGVVRDAVGQLHGFRMTSSAVYLKDGAQVTAQEVRLLDEVRLLLDGMGRGRLLEVAYTDLLADAARVELGTLVLRLPSGEERPFAVLPGAVILVNGREAAVDALDGAGPVYAVLDGRTGALRIVQALKNAREGFYVGLTAGGREMVFVVEEEDVRYPVSPDLVVLVENERVGAEYLLPGDEVWLALDDAGRVAYVEVVR